MVLLLYICLAATLASSHGAMVSSRADVRITIEVSGGPQKLTDVYVDADALLRGDLNTVKEAVMTALDFQDMQFDLIANKVTLQQGMKIVPGMKLVVVRKLTTGNVGRPSQSEKLETFVGMMGALHQEVSKEGKDIAGADDIMKSLLQNMDPEYLQEMGVAGATRKTTPPSQQKTQPQSMFGKHDRQQDQDKLDFERNEKKKQQSSAVPGKAQNGAQNASPRVQTDAVRIALGRLLLQKLKEKAQTEGVPSEDINKALVDTATEPKLKEAILTLRRLIIVKSGKRGGVDQNKTG